MSFKLGLAGDTMLGRGVAQQLRTTSPKDLFSEDVVEFAREADLFVLNLECCISRRGTRWSSPGKPFFFRAPPVATEVLEHLGVDCVTLANNHALDFGEQALLDTFDHLEGAGIAWVGAGREVTSARASVRLETDDASLTVLGFSDHPDDFAAGDDRAGIAYADLRSGLPQWLGDAVASAGDHVLVMAHWGPNMVASPRPFVRAAGSDLLEAGASLVVGHSAHVFHGVNDRVLYDIGDFIDDYAVDAVLRNDLGLIFMVSFDDGPVELEALPLKLDYCYTRVAEAEDADWITTRLTEACSEFETTVFARGGRPIVPLR